MNRGSKSFPICVELGVLDLVGSKESPSLLLTRRSPAIGTRLVATINVLVVDDIADTRAMVGSLVDSQSDMRTVGVLESADEVVAEARRLRADVVVLDLRMPGLSPVEAIRELQRSMPYVRVIAFSGNIHGQSGGELAGAGACGLVAKGSEPLALIECIRNVAGGNTCFARVRPRQD